MTALRKVLVVIGTTGAGKTKLSVDLAKAVGGEIVNSDAMQMYRGLDVATAKITEDEKQNVPHHLFDVVDPSARCDVLEFKRLALQTIDDILARGKVPIVVGGTMYYTQAVLWKSQLLDDVPVKASADGPGRADTAAGARGSRSLQVFEQTGVPHSELLAQQEREQRHIERYFDACAFWVHASKPVLSERLATRVDTMLSSGLVEEIRGLRAQVKENPPRMNPDSDDEGAEFGGYSASDRLNVATRQYARRQLSWIRNKFVTKNIPVYQVDSSDVPKWDTLVAQPAIEIAHKFLKGEEITSYQTVQQQQPDAAQAASLEDKFQKNTCDVCNGREFTGKKQWAEHFRSKGHKYHLKRIQIEKERAERGEPPISNKRRRQEEKEVDRPHTATEAQLSG
ncbi:hypothetical protein PRIC2_009116 [Phytophthora ramorum]